MSDALTRATPDEQFAEVTRAHVDLQVPQELKDKLKQSYEKKQPLVIKAGFDPTAPDLHLGHTVVLQRMRRFQDFGHQIVFIIGGFTAMIGDPTGKNATRPALTKEQVATNAETYKQQLFKVLDREKTIVRNNAEWLEPLGAHGMIRLAARYTVARMLERADFAARYAAHTPISVHEFLYPLLQGWDSVAIKADVELGGSDQIFNLLVGRQLMKEEGLSPQVVMTSPLLEGLDAKLVDGKLVGDKMSKSNGNYVGVSEPANEQYGKLMSITDDLMWRYFDLLSARTTAEIAELKKGHPKAAKVALAKEIVARFNDAAAADAAEQAFENRARGGVPDDVAQKSISLGGAAGMNIRKLLVEAGLATSNSEAQRLITQGGLSINGEKCGDPKKELGAGEYLLKAGKRHFAKVTLA